MGIAGVLPNSNNLAAESKLKLLAATRLPAVPSPVPKLDSLSTFTKNQHAQPVELSDEALAQVSKLKARDTQVREHEQAHLSASAGLNVSRASFTYQKGPNEVNYVVGGDVKIDSSPGHTPEETLARAEKIIDAALAPADPSPTDRSVAARAQQMAVQARADIRQQEIQQSRQLEQQANLNQAYGISLSTKSIDLLA